MLLATSCAAPANLGPSDAPVEADVAHLIRCARNEAPEARAIYDRWLDELTRSQAWLLSAIGAGPHVEMKPTQPDMEGQVVLLDQAIVVLQVRGGLPEELPSPMTFTLFNGRGYVAEALVLCARGDMVACHVLYPDGAVVHMGDRACTNL